MSKSHRDVYQSITDQIVADLERGVRPWSNTRWQTTGGIPRRANGESYRGINVLLLWIAASKHGYSSCNWLTFKQALALGGCVRKGEKATHILFFDRFTKEDTREGHEGEETTIAFAKTYAVFNAEQVDGLPAGFGHSATADGGVEVLADGFFSALGVDVRHGGSRAFFSPTHDYVQMPQRSDFVSSDAYAATLAHEIVHWTGHRSRLERDFSAKGTEAYAVEELVAEIGAAFLCATLGIAEGEREDHAAYIAAYLSLLRDDKRVFVRAASAAQKAADFLHARAAADRSMEVIAA